MTVSGNYRAPVTEAKSYNEANFRQNQTNAVAVTEEESIREAEFRNTYVKITQAQVKKIWNDNNNDAKKRPASLTVDLYAHVPSDDTSDGEKLAEHTVTLNEGNNWTSDEISDLPVYDDEGNEIEYHWVEQSHTGYMLTSSVTEGTITTLTNTLADYDDVIDYEGIKNWDDDHDYWGVCPEHISSALTVKLYRKIKKDGNYVDDENNPYKTEPDKWVYDDDHDKWTYTFEDLPVFDQDGNVIMYYAKEENVSAPYAKTNEVITDTAWTQGTIAWDEGNARVDVRDTESVLQWNLVSVIDLAVIAIKPTSSGPVQVWTNRTPTPYEKEKIEYALKVEDKLPGCKNRAIVYYSGSDATLTTPHGTATISMNGLNVQLSFPAHDIWAQFITGQFNGGTDGGTYNIGTAEFTNSYEAGSLTVTKTATVNGEASEDEFQFMVTLTKEGVIGKHGELVVNGVTTDVNFIAQENGAEDSGDIGETGGTGEAGGSGETGGTGEAGGAGETGENDVPASVIGKAIITFTLKTGQTAKLLKLPVGTAYVVEELSKDQNGYVTMVTSTGTNHGTVNDDKTVTGTIPKEKAAEEGVVVAYTNTKETISIEAPKTWQNAEGENINASITKAKVAFELQESTDDSVTWTKVTKKADGGSLGNPIIMQVEDTADAEAWKASWANLPKQKYVETTTGEGADAVTTYSWKDVRYRVVETAATYKDNSAMPGNAAERTQSVTITGNKGTAEAIVTPLRNFEVEKEWEEYEELDPENTVVTMILHRAIKDGDNVYVDESFSETFTLPANSDDPTDPVKMWKKSWTDLAKSGKVEEEVAQTPDTEPGTGDTGTQEPGTGDTGTQEPGSGDTGTQVPGGDDYQPGGEASDEGGNTQPTKVQHTGDWFYYVTEENVTVNGESVKEQFAITDGIGATNEEGTKSTVINKPGLTEFSFKKKWTDGVSDTARSWPTNGGNKLPITVVLKGNLEKTVTDAQTGEETTTTITTLNKSETEDDYTFILDPNEGAADTVKLPREVTIYIGGQQSRVTISMAEDPDNQNFYIFTFESLPISGKDATSGETGKWVYHVTEIQVPEYQPPKYLKADGQPHENGDTGAYEGETIVNNPIVYELPSTGGIGTTIFYTAGISLMMLAVLSYVLTARRREWEEGV